MILPSVRLMRQAAATLVRQQRLITHLQIEQRHTDLAHMRIIRDLIEQFLISLDMPENNDDYRANLARALRFYRDEIAVLEEHIR